ncbi:acetolactate synthase 2 small subunit [Tolumonas osonensis]|uniref:Acetolactate synthase II small subunit n=1 Tax=Tolumonas osonensis TaxID=675874 RepID=A0A841GIM2_9GAMM|nr:acetolactate synthase 2 small subunit [Tolumonas osonensis]MBB6056526.1 acetolactate synthase II small subunit [Tolumonas osonensis]
MKQHQLNLITGSRPEVLERVLRVVRHRGFALRQLNMEALPDSSSLRIAVTVESERPIQLLQSQLNKLVDVFHVEALDQSEQSALQISA